jgi:hypothetical protein
MKEALAAYIKRVKELADHVKGNEQAAKQSLIGPLFTILGYDLTDPRECVPEYKADFGKDRSNKPVDWAFLQNGKPVFFVEAKDTAKKLAGYDEQLGDYFAKVPEAKLGILTNGIHWRFYTDAENANVMDREPFLEWDVRADEQPPLDFLTVLQKAQYKAELVRAFAQRMRVTNLIVSELNRLLEPAPEYIRLAIANIETRNLVSAVVDSWKPVLKSAIEAWARQRALSVVLEPRSEPSPTATSEPDRNRIETTPEELEGFSVVQRLLGEDRPVQHEDTASYFKVHLPGRRTWVVCRFYFGKRKFSIWVPLTADKVSSMLPGFDITAPFAEWASISLRSLGDIDALGSVLCAAWDHQAALRSKAADPGTDGLSD